MSKKRKNKNGMTFENAINLVDWSFNRIEDYEYGVYGKFEVDVENFIDKRIEKLRKSLKKADERIREIASEAVQIAFEHQLATAFCDVSEKPWLMSIFMEDFAEDGYFIEFDIRETIRKMLLERCSAGTGYVAKGHEEEILAFAAMLDELSNELKTSIPTENNNA